MEFFLIPSGAPGARVGYLGRTFRMVPQNTPQETQGEPAEASVTTATTGEKSGFSRAHASNPSGSKAKIFSLAGGRNAHDSAA